MRTRDQDGDETKCSQHEVKTLDNAVARLGVEIQGRGGEEEREGLKEAFTQKRKE
jgi:hypothetical protein